MKNDISVKQRVIKIIEIFEKETDEFNEISIDGLIKKLKDKFQSGPPCNFSVEKRAIKEDLKEIEAAGFSINKDIGSNGTKLYYHHERKFEIYELRLLIDAVSSAKFITKKETEKIICKLKSLTSNGLSKKLDNRIHLDDMVKSNNNLLKLYLDEIHDAISQTKKISFQYGNFTTDKEFVLHHNGDYYLKNPYALVWSNDFYYLVCRDDKDSRVINYRVDRMVAVKKTDLGYKKEQFDIAAHLNGCFNMYPGAVEAIEIKFKNKLINAVIDKLGKDMNSHKIDDYTFKVRFHAAINEGLLRWILMWGADAKVLQPESLILMMKNESEKMNNIYK